MRLADIFWYHSYQQGYGPPPQQYGGYNQGPPVRCFLPSNSHPVARRGVFPKRLRAQKATRACGRGYRWLIRFFDPDAIPTRSTTGYWSEAEERKRLSYVLVRLIPLQNSLFYIYPPSLVTEPSLLYRLSSRCKLLFDSLFVYVTIFTDYQYFIYSLAVMCCCFLCEESCECCLDCFECCEGCDDCC